MWENPSSSAARANCATAPGSVSISVCGYVTPICMGSSPRTVGEAGSGARVARPTYSAPSPQRSRGLCVSDIEQLRRLVAREQIRDLVHRYAVAVDSHQVDDIADLFDPQMDSAKYGQGQDGVRAFYAHLTGEADPAALHHNIGVHQIDLIDDDHAAGLCYMLGVAVSGTTWLEMAGIYADRYVRRGDRWYFAERTWASTGILRLDSAEPFMPPGAPTAADVWEIHRRHRAERLARTSD